MKPAFPLRYRQFVFRQREVIETDLPVACFHQSFGNRLRLGVASCRIGKRVFVDQPLVLLEARDVSVAEHGEALRAHGHRQIYRLDAGRNSLMRETVDEVEVDGMNAIEAQVLDGRERCFRRLDAVDRLLHLRIEALDAKAGAGHAGFTQCCRHFGLQAARVDLDCRVYLRRETELRPEGLHQLDEFLRLDDGRRAATEMDLAHIEAGAPGFGNQIYLPMQHLEIVEDRLVFFGDGRVAPAVPAHGSAEGDVEVKGRCSIRRNCLQP